MGDPKGFIKMRRKDAGNRPIKERIYDYGEVEQTLNEADRKLQASRCMDCGIPFCNWGCPVHNNIPEWQDYVYQGDWKKASDSLHATNNFPEFTGRICPAPCEASCVLNIQKEPVTIRENECSIVEKAFELGYILPNPSKKRTEKKVAVIGSGPAGLACADQLSKAGYIVTLFEKDDAIGGLLRYGIPDFKLNKKIIDRRIEVMVAEGLIVKTNTDVGKDIKAEALLKDFNAICICIGSMVPRDLNVEGRDLKGIYFAMEFLKQQNQVVNGIEIDKKDRISAMDKNVLIIGGGDTGSDCIGTSVRHGAKSITQIEIMPMPPKDRKEDNPWPYWPLVLKTSSSHEEGCIRRWTLATKKFIGKNGKLVGVEVVEVKWEKHKDGKFTMKEVPNTIEEIKADLVLLAMGFVHPMHEGLVKDLNLKLDNHGNIQRDEKYKTNVPKVFAAGDAERGASLVVHAIWAGRQAAENINQYLKK